MRVLWFTNTPSLLDQSNQYNGGGWISSLQEFIQNEPDIELGISFFSSVSIRGRTDGNVTYIPICLSQNGPIRKLYRNWNISESYKDQLCKIENVVSVFKPDVIHVFGTEGPFGLIQSFVKVPVVIHLQGILTPYCNAFYPPGMSDLDVIFSKRYFIKNMLGNSLAFDRRRLSRNAARERQILRLSRNIMGRTAWDRDLSMIYAPNATYYHVDECLRPPFYTSKNMAYKEAGSLNIISTISNTIYKGFDVILKTAKILRDVGTDFKWTIIGVTARDTVPSFVQSWCDLKAEKLNISFAGVLSGNELMEKMLLSDIYVHPSYIDNSPNSICEAQILGLPVIASNVGGISSLVRESETGCLVSPNSPEELASKILQFGQKRSGFQYMALRARQEAAVRHDRMKIKTKVVDIYKALCN